MSSFYFVTTTNISRPGTREFCCKVAGAECGRFGPHLPHTRREQGECITAVRFGHRHSKPFRPLICEICEWREIRRRHCDSRYQRNNPTTKGLLQQFPFDNYYARGNGYREESDFQMNLFVHGFESMSQTTAIVFTCPLSRFVREASEPGRSSGSTGRSFIHTYFSANITRHAQRMA